MFIWLYVVLAKCVDLDFHHSLSLWSNICGSICLGRCVKGQLEFVTFTVLDGFALPEEIGDACSGRLHGFWGLPEIVCLASEGSHLRFGWSIGS